MIDNVENNYKEEPLELIGGSEILLIKLLFSKQKSKEINEPERIFILILFIIG